MARTYYNSAMEDISLFSTATSLEELELFNSFSLTGENEFALDYDVYSCIEETKPPVTNLLAEDLLQEFDFEDGGGLLDSDWMTEKLEFNTAEPVLAIQTDPLMDLDAVEVTSVESPQVSETSEASKPDKGTILKTEDSAVMVQSEDNIFAGVEEILKRLCADRKIPFNEGSSSEPSSPLQNVPEVEVHSPCSVTLPSSEITDRMLQLAQSDGESVSCPSSPGSPGTEASLVTSMMQVKKAPSRTTYFSPYQKEKLAKVKSPQQKKRKREQNKDAATRYRIKKREEQDSIHKELSGLEKENVELKDQVTSLSKEIEYLKNLMLEVYKNKLQKQAVIALKVN